ncbi:MAG: hypothetical protein GY703_06175 [Gammaproteobacteria bacterium]|nr:hypothetical protein [Gammaproteobacteria bacterium]
MTTTPLLSEKRCRNILKGLLEDSPNRTPALLITLFADIVLAHGDEIWLGSLIRLLEPMGLGERLVRTSVYRLTRDNWLEGNKSGRRRYYRLRDSIKPTIDQLNQRIYCPAREPWDGQWRLVFTGTQGIDTTRRTELRKRLSAAGFGIIAPNVYGHPTARIEPVWELFGEMGVTNRIVVMKASNIDSLKGLTTREMARQCFKLETLESEYDAFIKRFIPLIPEIEKEPGLPDLDPPHCFILRTMLIHHYRSILSRDPWLPAELLPGQWIGTRAHRMCGAIYHSMAEGSEHFIRQVCENRDGYFSTPKPSLLERFSKQADGGSREYPDS